jgi:hypothetical protein
LEHWFDEFTKQLATRTPSRGTLIRGIAATVGAVTTSAQWQPALAATRKSSALSTVKSETFGPCTMTSSPTHYERHFASATHAAGRAISYRRSHTYDLKQGTSLDTTILIDGKPALEMSSLTLRSSTSYKLRVVNAFGFKEALLTSTDGKTLHGEVDGRAIAPYAGNSNSKLEFADGKPFVGHRDPALEAAVSAAFTQANKDLGRCVPRAQASAGELQRVADRPGGGAQYLRSPAFEVAWAGPGACGASMLAMTGDAVFNAGCVNCGNTCTSKSNTCEAVNFFKCVACFLTGVGCGGCYEATVGCSSKDFNCLSKCNADHACLGQLCTGWPPPAASLSPYLTCHRGDVCVSHFALGQGGYCCPHTHPTPCPGSWAFNGAPGGDQTIIGTTLANNFCCFADDVCLQSGSTGCNNNAFQCCPKAQVCGSLQKGTSIYKGSCCPPGTICYGNGQCCHPQNLCRTIMPGAKAPAHGTPATCCRGVCKNGMCCEGRWCEDTCCPGDSRCGKGGTCHTLCLSGQVTTKGVCCDTGTACGSKCCTTGCADRQTSTCKTAKCAAPLYSCTSSMPKSNATEIVCCPKGSQCYGGHCCAPGKVACANASRGGKFGCWEPSKCQAPPK